MALPERYWRGVHVAVRERRFDAGQWVQFAMNEEGEIFVLACRDISSSGGSGSDAEEPDGLMLLDHAWSFATLADAKQSLTVVDGLLQRVHELLFPALSSDELFNSASATAEAVNRVMEALQTKIGSYTTAAENKSQGRNTTFFLLDEVGARMGQARVQSNASSDQQPEPEAADAASDEQQEQHANYKCLPFFSLDDRVAYSVGWPCADLHAGDELIVSTDASDAAWTKLQCSDTTLPTDGAYREILRHEMRNGKSAGRLSNSTRS